MLLFKRQGYFKNKFSNLVDWKKVEMSEACAQMLCLAKQHGCRDTGLASRWLPQPH